MDVQTALYFAGAAGSALGLVGLWAWNHTHKRIDDAWEHLDNKAQNDELDRVRDTQQKMFEQMRQHDAEDRTRHETVLTGIAKMEGRLDMILHEIRNKK